MTAQPDRQGVRQTTDGVEQFVRLLDRDDVRQAVLFASAGAVAPDSLADFPVPEGMTHDQAIELVTAVRRMSSVYSPIPDRDGRLAWYVYTHLMRQTLSNIDRRCTRDSRLFDETGSRAGARFLIQSNVDEAISAALLDGVRIDYDSAKDLLLMRRQPRTFGERLVLNMFQLGEQLSEMADLPWTPEAMHGLYARLTEGVPAVHPKSPLPDAAQREAALRGLCEYAGSDVRATCEHPAITASLVRTGIAYFQPFPAWNGLMSRLIFRLYAIKSGYPILGNIPISRSELELAGRPGEYPPTEMPNLWIQTVDRYHELDLTAWLTKHLALMNHALEQLESRMDRAAAIDKAVSARLEADSSLNHRQRSIIGRALRLPGATFRIGYHRTTHGIGYATAHRDFAALVEQGYLVPDTQGRAIVFTAAPDLEERFGSLEHVGRIEDFEVELPPHLLTGE